MMLQAGLSVKLLEIRLNGWLCVYSQSIGSYQFVFVARFFAGICLIFLVIRELVALLFHIYNFMHS